MRKPMSSPRNTLKIRRLRVHDEIWVRATVTRVEGDDDGRVTYTVPGGRAPITVDRRQLDDDAAE
jgi:hypothetical protein